MEDLQNSIEKIWNDRSLLELEESKTSIRDVIELLDKGKIRVAEPDGDNWMVHEWIKKAVLMYFPIQEMKTIECGPLEFHDKIPLKKD